MKRVGVLLQLKQIGVVAVVRANNVSDAIETSEAIIKGGIKGIEVTYTTPNAADVIKHLSEKYNNTDVLIGAGTVLEAISTVEAIKAGSKFIVSPAFDEESAKMCNLYKIPYLPGAITPTEITKALLSGVSVIKLFPGNAFSPSYIKALKAPLPHVEIMPTGGVNLANMSQWFQNGAFAVGIGGDLTAPLADRDFNKITEIAKAYIDEFNSINKV